MKLKLLWRELRKVSILNFNVFFILLLLLCPLISKSESALIQTENFDGFLVDLAKDKNKREVGLMKRDVLTNSNGMLFLYDKLKIVNMWMYKTKLPLDIIFIDENHRISSIRKGIPFSKNIISSDIEVIAVLEILNNCAEKLNLKVGDEIKWSEINNKSLINSFGMNSKRLPCLNN